MDEIFSRNAQRSDYPGSCTCRFVWSDGGPNPFHFYLLARRSFELAAAPEWALLRITASGRYIAYLNGTCVGRGLARSDTRWKSYDSYDVGEILRPGTNVVAVHAYHYGCKNNCSRDERAGLFAELSITWGGGGLLVVATDESWRVEPARGYLGDVKPINAYLGVTEDYDANVDPDDWTEADFDVPVGKTRLRFLPEYAPGAIWIRGLLQCCLKRRSTRHGS